MVNLAIFFRLAITLFLVYTGMCKNTILRTKLGRINGTVSDEAGGTVFKFLKVPYARPPTGNLRFRKPVPVDPWNGIVDATKHPPSCIQPTTFYSRYAGTAEMSEDCLFLSIYVPNELSCKERKSVMVWIHGGGYDFGQASAFDGTNLALVGDVIVVTINYRLNVFGFLSTFDSAARGNYGLWDQILALKWVKSNIETFGGNPDSVTIFGESAGGFSVGLLSLMPRNKRLFHRVIAQSGTANSPLAYNDKFQSHVYSFIRKVGCYGKTYKTSYSVVECLRKLPAEALLNATINVYFSTVETYLIIPFAPTIDFELITHDPVKMIKNPFLNRFFRSLDFMTGVTSGEGGWVLSAAQRMAPDLHINATQGLPKEFLCDIFAPKFSENHYETSWKVSKAICEMYEVSEDDKIEQGKKIVELAGDPLFNYPAVESLQAHTRYRKQSSTYQYLFSRKYPDLLPSWFTDAAHGSELPYLFGLQRFANIDNVTFSEKDYNFANILMEYWTNFAKYGNPNSAGLPSWPQYTHRGKQYVDLNLQIKRKSDVFSKRMQFWSEVIPRISGQRKYN